MRRIKFLASFGVLILLFAGGKAWAYEFDCARGCGSLCGGDMGCLIRCYTCCPPSIVSREVDCNLCRGVWENGICESSQGSGECSLEAPSINVPQTAEIGSSYTVSWESVQGAEGYQLCETQGNFSGENSGECWNLTATSKEFSHNSTGIYSYRVRAVSGECKSQWSNVGSIKVSEASHAAEPPKTQDIGPANPQTAPVQFTDGSFSIAMKYTAPVDVVIGFADCRFTHVYWLNPSACVFGKPFSWQMGKRELKCSHVPLPEGLSSGIVFWLVAPKSLAELEFSHDPYLLKFYQVGSCISE